jgi:hypothetical protein
LGDIYRKAGVAFRGQLEQNFVVLQDKYEWPMKRWVIQAASEQILALQENVLERKRMGSRFKEST